MINSQKNKVTIALVFVIFLFSGSSATAGIFDKIANGAAKLIRGTGRVFVGTVEIAAGVSVGYALAKHGMSVTAESERRIETVRISGAPAYQTTYCMIDNMQVVVDYNTCPDGSSPKFGSILKFI